MDALLGNLIKEIPTKFDVEISFAVKSILIFIFMLALSIYLANTASAVTEKYLL